MASKTYDGYRITELRRHASEMQIAGRSKMTGDELLVAVRAVWDARREAAERELLAVVDVKPGTLLRHKSAGYVVRVLSEVSVWEPYGALVVDAEYVSYPEHALSGGWRRHGGSEAYAAFTNEGEQRRREQGDIPRHPLWQYEAVEQADAAPCGEPWVAEIELCPRCGLDASQHPRSSVSQVSDPAMASETNPHPDAPGGPWAAMGNCPTCGAGAGFPCRDVEMFTDGNALLGHAHPERIGLGSTPQDRSADGVPEVEQDEAPRPGPRTMALGKSTRAKNVGVIKTRQVCVRTDGSHANHVEPVDGMNCDPDHPTAEDERVTAAQREAFGSPAPAPTHADDVAALRSILESRSADKALRALAVLDRIAARAPQRATDGHGDLLWRHHCGAPAAGEAGFAPQYCSARDCYTHTGTWVPLYVVLGGAA